MTGHQPELYHPGVWAKDFLLQRLADETGAAAIDLVVDSDGFDAVEMRLPVPAAGAWRGAARTSPLGGADACYACAPVPTAEHVRGVLRRG